ncbi:MAG: hypothetical protein ABSF93_17760 [Candidatus Sulfotelmatobacter sp.]|jgi:hypothetical protein
MLRDRLLVSALLFISPLCFAQDPPPWPCADQVTSGVEPVRVSAGVSAAMAEKKVLPDTSDLKGTKANSTVVVRILIDKSGVVRCAEGVQGDPGLFQRSQDAAMQWHFKPYLLYGRPLNVATSREFVFKKNKVTAH